MPQSNDISRRKLSSAALLAALPLLGQETSPEHEMHGLKHVMPKKAEKIVMLGYPGMAALDLVGPHQVFGYVMGAEVNVVWKDKNPFSTDVGLLMMATQSFEEVVEADIVFVPGGAKQTIALMEDEQTLSFLKRIAKKAQYITSVCSGSLVLGAAGLLQGYKATSHWAVRDVLSSLGAIPVEARYVVDRNRITAGGITSGIDFALRIAAKLRGDDYARSLELTLEYDPQPPFASGTLKKAPARISKATKKMYEPLNASAMAAAARVRSRAVGA
jgi:cyclohexyl-isocyanide hydratase